jgi:PAS domain S-box-containing protein
LVALGLIAVATLLRLGLHSILGTGAPLSTFIAASLIAAWWSGTFSAILVSALGSVIAVALFWYIDGPLSLTSVRAEGPFIMGLLLNGLGIWLIDSLHQTRRELEAETSRFKRLTEGMSEFFMIIDASLKIVDANEALSKAIGTSRTDLVGSNLADRWPRSRTFHERFLTSLRTSEPIHEVLQGEMTNRFFEVHAYPAGQHLYVFFRDVSEEKEAELKLAAIQETYRLATDAVQGFVYDWSIESDTVSRSSGFEELIGVPIEDADPSHLWWVNRVHPEDRAIARPDLSGPEVWTKEYRIRHDDARYIWVLDRARILYDAEGKPIRVVGQAVDISANRELQSRLRAIVDANPIGILLTKPNGHVIECNEAFSNIVGISKAEILENELGWQNFIPNQWKEKEEEALRTVLETGRCEPFEIEFVRGSETRIPVLTAVAEIPESDGLLAAFVVDLSAQYQAERQVYQILNSVPQIAWTARPDGFLDFYNDQWYDFTGFPCNTGGDPSWLPVIHPDDADRSLQTWYHSVRSGEDYEIEYRFFDRANGRYRWFLGRALPLRDAAGAITRWFGTCTDIDDQKQSEERLEQEVADRTAELRASNRELESFSYSVSHDLRSPLRAIMSASMILIEDWGDKLDPEAIGELTRMANAARKMGQLIDDLLEMSRIGRTQIDRENVDLSQLAAGLWEEMSLRRLIEDASLEIAPNIIGRGDARLLRLVLQNLFENSLKYRKVGEPARIEFGVDSQGFYVQDNGTGFDPQYATRIFEPFQRLHRDASIPGTGVGLANVQRIIERHGGRVWAESDPGVGTAIRFTLPA